MVSSGSTGGSGSGSGSGSRADPPGHGGTDRTDKFVWQGGDVRISQCAFCIHYRPGIKATCDAFPTGIPGAIMRNEYDHRHAYPGDNGIRFEPRPGTSWEDTGAG